MNVVVPLLTPLAGFIPPSARMVKTTLKIAAQSSGGSLCDLATPETSYERPACSKEEMLKGEFGRMYRLDCMLDECHWFEDYHSTPSPRGRLDVKSSGQDGGE